MAAVATSGSLVKAVVWYMATTAAEAVAAFTALPGNLALHPELATDPMVASQLTSTVPTAVAAATTKAVIEASTGVLTPMPTVAVALGSILYQGTLTPFMLPTGLAAVEGATGSVTTLAPVPLPYAFSVAPNLGSPLQRFFALDHIPLALVGGPVTFTPPALPGSYGKIVTGCPFFDIR